MTNNTGTPLNPFTAQARVEQNSPIQTADLGYPFGELPWAKLQEDLAAKASLEQKGRAARARTEVPTPANPASAEYGFIPAIPKVGRTIDMNMAAMMAQQQQEVPHPAPVVVPQQNNNLDIMNWQPGPAQAPQEPLHKVSQHLNILAQPFTGLDKSGKTSDKTVSTVAGHFDVMKAGVFNELKEAPKNPAQQQQEMKYHEILNKIRAIAQDEGNQRRVSDEATVITADHQEIQQNLMRSEIATMVSPSVDLQRKLGAIKSKKSVVQLLKEYSDVTLSAVKKYQQRENDKNQITLPGSPKRGKAHEDGGEFTGSSSGAKQRVG
ncbi:MAG: hypothetical protein M3Q44_00180 [bacterium]|nr:hypothetical protein [bacterium]